MSTLNHISIDGMAEFIEKNDIDLQCRTCKGQGETRARPDGMSVEQFAPTPEQIEEKSLFENTEYFRVLGLESLADEVYDMRNEAEEAMEDQDNWPESEMETCPDCGNESGYHELMMNTIYDTGFNADRRSDELPRAIGPIVAFAYNGNVWFGMSGGGMDLSPYFIAAWFEMFTDVQWIPDNFINHTNLFGGYYSSCCGQELEDKILQIYASDLASTAKRAAADLKRVKEFVKAKAAKGKGKKAKV